MDQLHNYSLQSLLYRYSHVIIHSFDEKLRLLFLGWRVGFWLSNIITFYNYKFNIDLLRRLENDLLFFLIKNFSGDNNYTSILKNWFYSTLNYRIVLFFKIFASCNFYFLVYNSLTILNYTVLPCNSFMYLDHYREVRALYLYFNHW